MKTRGLLLLIALVLTPPAFADTYRRADQIRKSERQKFEVAIAATIPVHFPGQHCTGVFVGRTGELLTNLHCLEPCLSEGSSLTTSVRLSALGVRLVQPTSVAVGHRCPLRFGKKLREGTAEVLAIFGPGWISPREALGELLQRSPNDLRALMSQGYEAAGDLALIRLHEGDAPEAAMTSPACAVVSPRPSPGTPRVLGLAYPLLARKTDNPFDPLLTLGTTLMWSEGEVTRNPEEYLQVAEAGPEAAAVVDWMFPGGTVMSSIDAEKGASGSPIFDQSQNVVAIVRSVFKPEGTNYIPWRTQAIDLETYRHRIDELLGTSTCADPRE